MENAAKALIIAGAVLIVILLISVGLYVFKSASEPTREGITQMSETQISMFNNKFMPYIGNGISGSDVRTLISKVKVSNSQNAEDKQVSLIGVTSVNNVDLKAKYNVSADDEDSDGIIDVIRINGLL